ncbi:hypothetical protein DPSP01_012672 [Paraphaeosphaeria sporulosa]
MPVVLDVMTIGKAGVEGVRVSDLKDVNLMLDVSQSIGHNEIDDARLYGGESSELYPNEGKGNMGDNVYSHRPEDVRRGLLASLKAIETEKVEKWYLHGPDHTTSLQEPLRGENSLCKEGYFECFILATTCPGKQPLSVRYVNAMDGSNPPSTKGCITCYTKISNQD